MVTQAATAAGHHGPPRDTQLAALLRRYRHIRRLSQDQLAARVGDHLTRSAIGHYETGRTLNPRMEVLVRLKSALAIPDDEWNTALWEDGLDRQPSSVAEARSERLAGSSSYRQQLALRLQADRLWLEDGDRALLDDLREVMPALKTLARRIRDGTAL